MNERYQELVRLAVEDAAKYSKRRFDITVEENETFALCLTELIVQECAEILDEKIYPTSHPFNALGPKLKEHFGVKE